MSAPGGRTDLAGIRPEVRVTAAAEATSKSATTTAMATTTATAAAAIALRSFIRSELYHRLSGNSRAVLQPNFPLYDRAALYIGANLILALQARRPRIAAIAGRANAVCLRRAEG